MLRSTLPWSEGSRVPAASVGVIGDGSATLHRPLDSLRSRAVDRVPLRSKLCRQTNPVSPALLGVLSTDRPLIRTDNGLSTECL